MIKLVTDKNCDGLKGWKSKMEIKEGNIILYKFQLSNHNFVRISIEQSLT